MAIDGAKASRAVQNAIGALGDVDWKEAEEDDDEDDDDEEEEDDDEDED